MKEIINHLKNVIASEKDAGKVELAKEILEILNKNQVLIFIKDQGLDNIYIKNKD